MNKPVGAGVSSACFFPLETADSVKILSEWHIPNIEIFFNSFQELKDGYLERLSALCREAGTQVVSIHPFTSNSESLYFFTSYPGRLQDGLMIYRPFLRAAQKLGARVLVFHGATLQNRMDIPQSAANLRVLDRVAREEYGVTVAYENVVRCRGKDPDYFVQLREYYPELRFVLDVSVEEFLQLHARCRDRRAAPAEVLALANEITPEPVALRQGLNQLSGVR